jgi:hypothetical protein
MIILVADSSVLIDLERGNLLEVALSGPDVLAAPDFLYEAEIRDNGGPELLRLGLQIIELDAAEMTASQVLVNNQNAMSLPDCTAYICSRRPAHELLTNDRPLRTYAEANGVPCHGVLWLLDRLHDTGTTSADVLHEGLSRIAAHRRCRLPRNEIAIRLRRWRP